LRGATWKRHQERSGILNEAGSRSDTVASIWRISARSQTANTQSTEDLIEGLHNWQLFTVKSGEASRMLSQALLKERH